MISSLHNILIVFYIIGFVRGFIRINKFLLMQKKVNFSMQGTYVKLSHG